MTEVRDMQTIGPIDARVDRVPADAHVRRHRGAGRDRSSRQKRSTIWILCAFPIFYGLVGLSLGADTNWDLLNYHFLDPYWVLTNHMHDVMPATRQTYANPLLDIPFYLAAR